MIEHSYKVRVLGSGPTGAVLALSLAERGVRVILEDPLTISQLCNRSRAYAITHSSKRLFIDIGIWEELVFRLIFISCCSFIFKNTLIKKYPKYEITTLILTAFGSYALSEKRPYISSFVYIEEDGEAVREFPELIRIEKNEWIIIE